MLKDVDVILRDTISRRVELPDASITPETHQIADSQIHAIQKPPNAFSIRECCKATHTRIEIYNAMTGDAIQPSRRQQSGGRWLTAHPPLVCSMSTGPARSVPQARLGSAA
jgi:hypothetical protein